jgi:hypothetical protein
MNLVKTQKAKLRVRRTFLSKGACSHTFFYILNHEFGHNKPHEEQALDPLAGGIVQQGYQCGMLWGASMAVAAEALRRTKDIHKATGVAIKGTQYIIESFSKRTNTIACEEITKCNWSNKWSIFKYLISGKMFGCFNLASKWAPEAIDAAYESLTLDQSDISNPCLSCASEVIRKMGGTDEEIVMVAGFAGGLGLSGSGCGALAAAIWKIILELVKKEQWKYTLNDPVTENIIKTFYKATDYKMECSEICDKAFDTVNEHSEFIKNGGCESLIDTLSKIEVN